MSKKLQSPHLGSSLEEFHQKQLKQPEYREEYDRLDLQRRIAKVIADKRKEKHLSQRELAERANTKQAVISRIENGNVSVGIQLLQRIADALGSRIEIVLK